MRRPSLILSARRAIYKAAVAPLRYHRAGGGYDALRFWTDRFTRYGTSLVGSGHEGLSEAENQREYERGWEATRHAISRAGLSLPDCRVLDVGCGPGYFAERLEGEGVHTYVGLDITDVLFPQLSERFPAYQFITGDITRGRPGEEFDVVLMIDVLEHIVRAADRARAIEALEQSVAPNGIAILGPLFERRRRRFFYVRLWSVSDVVGGLKSLEPESRESFKGGYLLSLRRPERQL